MLSGAHVPGTDFKTGAGILHVKGLAASKIAPPLYVVHASLPSMTGQQVIVR